MNEQNNFSCKKKKRKRKRKKTKPLVIVVLEQAAEISLGWIRAANVHNVIPRVGVRLLWVLEDGEWLKLKGNVTFGLCCRC
jgi:arginine decarboxylase-like protein